jgi:hypothetical protein
MDRCVERPSGPPPDARAVVRSFGTEQVRSPFDRSSGRLASKACGRAVARGYVRLAALCGLLRCEIAEDPKGNRRRRSMRRMPRELASGSSEKWRRPVSTGVSIPGSGPAADHHVRSASGQSQCILRTVLRTIAGTRRKAEALVGSFLDNITRVTGVRVAIGRCLGPLSTRRPFGCVAGLWVGMRICDTQGVTDEVDPRDAIRPMGSRTYGRF